MAGIKDVVFDCTCASTLARFWAAALDDYEVRPYDDAEIARLAEKGLTPETDPVVFVDGPGPNLCFQEVPEAKVVKNRVHLDLVTSNRPVEVGRLCDLGATAFEEHEDHTLMRDPEDNEFCVYDPPTS